MVIRFFAASALTLALAGCSANGTTCGRGRCPIGSCLNVISTYVASSEYQFDWWCAVPCPGNMSCGGDLCLQSPINWTDTICAGNQIEVKYLYLADTTTPSGRRMGNYSIVNAHVTGATVQCTPGQVCAAGWYQAGELLPTLQTAGSGGMMENVGMNGTPGELAKLSATANDAGINVPLGPLLPTGVPIVIQLSGKDDGT